MNENKKAYYLRFGEHLKALIKKNNTDAQSVAALGKIESKQVYRVLNGEHGASLGNIIAIARGLGVHPKKLFDFDFVFEE